MKWWNKLHKIWVERKWWQWSDDDDADNDDDADDDVDNDDDDCGTNRLKMILWQNCSCILANATRWIGRGLCSYTVKWLPSHHPNLYLKVNNTTTHTG